MPAKKEFTLIEYIREMHDWFIIDESNKKLIELLSLYAAGSKSFETADMKGLGVDGQDKLYLDKSLLIIGNVGTGKTELLRMINRYYNYVTGPRRAYRFQIANVPDLADDFSLKGRDAFAKIRKGNWAFDELCFINEVTGKPDRETAINFGDRVLIGEKVIYDRYNVFMETGWQSHGTTNASPKTLREVYGQRGYSRLLEMCNIFTYIREDRRPNIKPRFIKNHNKPVMHTAEMNPAPVDIGIESGQEDVMSMMEKEFETYRALRNPNYVSYFFYNAIQINGGKVEDYIEVAQQLKSQYHQLSQERLETYGKQIAISRFFDAIIESGQEFSTVFIK